jgi:AraC-like DNA-binding protein
MGERAVSIISSIAIINLLVTTLVCWLKSKSQRFYFWLGWLILASVLAMLNNLHIYLGYGNIWFYHLTLLLNVSYGAYLILFIRNHRYTPKQNFRQNLILFLPSVLYLPFLILTLLKPEWAVKTIDYSEEGKMTIFGMLYNFIIIIYSVGSNIWLLINELRRKKLEINNSARMQRVEILAVMAVLQLFAFVPFALKLDISYIILYMPIFGQIYFLYLFLRMWKLDKGNMLVIAKAKSTIDNSLKYATIKLSEERIQSIKNQINDLMESEKLYLIPEFSLSDLANKTGVAVNILSMVINSQMNTNFPDLINKYRIEKAKQLLPNMKKNNSTIETISYDCGFSNRTSFYTAFRKFTNQSPSEFIKEIEKGNLSVG